MAIKVDSFLDLLRRSELVEKNQLNRVLLELQGEADKESIADTQFVANRLVEAGLITSWQSDKLREGRHKGFFLGKYKLLGHLGSGGMSSVYLAEHVLMQRRVAIKVLPKNRVEDSSYLARFHREARAAAALDHRNIVRAYDVDNEGNVHYLVMEYIEGCDLYQMVKSNGPLDYAIIADYIRQAADGLQHAHAAGLIHRDVKPANLLVDQRKTVKVLDLGLARFADDKIASLTVAYDENVLGTADYLAPEQAIDSHGVDLRADIYSLGCSMYYLLTGRPPFPDGTLPQRLMMHQKHAPPSVFKVRADAPKDLVDICLKMMAKKPKNRYQTAADVSAAMADWMTAHGHAFDSDIGSDSGQSSGKFAAFIDRTKEKSGPSSGRLQKARPLGDESPSGKSRVTDNTIANQNDPTFTGSDSQKGRRGSGSSEKSLPKAKPLEENPQTLEGFLAQDNLSARTRNPMTDAQLEAYRSRRHSTSIYLWVGIGLGIALALVLVILTLITG